MRLEASVSLDAVEHGVLRMLLPEVNAFLPLAEQFYALLGGYDVIPITRIYLRLHNMIGYLNRGRIRRLIHGSGIGSEHCPDIGHLTVNDLADQDLLTRRRHHLSAVNYRELMTGR